MTKQYVCIKDYKSEWEQFSHDKSVWICYDVNISEWTVLSIRDDWYYKVDIGGILLESTQVENNPEYFKLVEEKPKEEKKGKLWRAEECEWYFSIEDSNSVVSCCDDRNWIDNARFNIGNYYRTKEDAQAVLDYKLLETELFNKYGWFDVALYDVECVHRDIRWKRLEIEDEDLQKFWDALYEMQQAQKNRFTTND